MKRNAEYLRLLMRTMFPDPAPSNDSEHRLDAIGTVLLAAGIFAITDQDELGRVTEYSKPFISAILFNLQGNKGLVDGCYDCREWLSSIGAINGSAL